MSDSLAITLHASGAEVAGGSGAAVDLWGTDLVETRRLAELTLALTAISGTLPALVVTVETSPDNATWRTVEAFASQSAAALVTIGTGDFDRYARVTWTLAGGGSASFAVTGTAHEAWCTLGQLAQVGSASAAISAVAKATRVQHLLAATQVAHGYVIRRHTAPIIRVGRDVAQAVAKMAALSLITDVIGANAHAEATALLLEEARAKERWFRDVSKGVAGADVVDSTPETTEASGAVVVTGVTRGFGSMRVV